MRYAILILASVLLSGCTREPPPLTADDLRHGISGKQWLAHEMEERRAIALDFRDQEVARAQETLEVSSLFLIAEFRNLDQLLREYDCEDRPQEVCDRNKDVLSMNLLDICSHIDVDDCTEAGMASGMTAFAELLLQKTTDQYNCATKIRILDREARKLLKGDFVRKARESCGWVEEPMEYLKTRQELGGNTVN